MNQSIPKQKFSIQSVINELFVMPPPVVLTAVYYKDLLEERKAKVSRLVRNAAKDHDLYAVQRGKMLVKEIDEQIIRVLRNEVKNKPLYSHYKVCHS